MSFRRLLSALCLALLLGNLPGCFLVVLGAATATAGVLYVEGALEAEVAASPPQTVEAGKAALEAKGFELVSANATDIDGLVVTRTATGMRVRIEVERVGSGVSRVWIRVGTFGDEPLSRELLEALKAQLAAGPVQPSPAQPSPATTGAPPAG